jgi:hypothetical protein
LLLPGVLVFWYVILLWAGGKPFVSDWFSWTIRGFLLGATALIPALIWTRGLLFFFLAKHWQEAERIITSRSSKV